MASPGNSTVKQRKINTVFSDLKVEMPNPGIPPLSKSSSPNPAPAAGQGCAMGSEMGSELLVPAGSSPPSTNTPEQQGNCAGCWVPGTAPGHPDSSLLQNQVQQCLGGKRAQKTRQPQAAPSTSTPHTAAPLPSDFALASPFPRPGGLQRSWARLWQQSR